MRQMNFESSTPGTPNNSTRLISNRYVDKERINIFLVQKQIPIENIHEIINYTAVGFRFITLRIVRKRTAFRLFHNEQ